MLLFNILRALLDVASYLQVEPISEYLRNSLTYFRAKVLIYFNVFQSRI